MFLCMTCVYYWTIALLFSFTRFVCLTSSIFFSSSLVETILSSFETHLSFTHTQNTIIKYHQGNDKFTNNSNFVALNFNFNQPDFRLLCFIFRNTKCFSSQKFERFVFSLHCDFRYLFDQGKSTNDIIVALNVMFMLQMNWNQQFYHQLLSLVHINWMECDEINSI